MFSILIILLIFLILLGGCTQTESQPPPKPTLVTVYSSESNVSIAEDLVISDYTVHFFNNGTLIEEFTYEVNAANQFTMLYRYWGSQLVYSAVDQPNIELKTMKIPAGIIGYVKDKNGNVRLFNSRFDSDVQDRIKAKAENNELGIYKQSSFAPGIYSVEYTYSLHPPIEYDDRSAHLNIWLADEHIPFHNVKIVLPAEYIVKIYPHPKSMNVTRQGESFLLSGEIPENEIVGFELLLSKDIMQELQGFPTYYDNIEIWTERANI